jgi:hypothetical protein
LKKPPLQSRLSQSGAAFSASTSVDILTQIFVACGTSPVGCAESGKRCDDQNLQYKDGMLRKLPEEVVAFMDHSKQNNEQQGYCYSEELPALAHPEILHNLNIVSLLNHHNFPGDRK